MSSLPRAGWQRVRTSLTGEIRGDLDEVRARLTELGEDVAALREAVGEIRRTLDVAVDVDNQVTELLGRLVRSASERLDELEERVSERR